MYPTKNDLPETTRTKVIEVLSLRLADVSDLFSQTKQAHWNVKGPSFIALHELFDDVAEAVEEYVDMIAERIVQLGGIAEGTVRVAAQKSSLSEYPLNIANGRDHVNALSSALAAFGHLARRAIDLTDQLGDKDTSDLFTEVSRGIDKWIWFVEAHIQAEQ
jgi:starvation-inducible DNA-binding protein